MRVTAVQITFSIKRGMQNYSSRGAEVTLGADVEEGDDYRAVMATLMDDAEAAVVNQIKLPSEREGGGA